MFTTIDFRNRRHRRRAYRFYHLHSTTSVLEQDDRNKPLDITVTPAGVAQRNGRALDQDGHRACADDNLFPRLSDAARGDFERGGGGELGTLGERGKIQATHSSSALACNWFDYWRDRDFGVLSTAFSVPSPFVTLRLEAHVPTGMRGADANLDMLLTTADGSLFGIESKCTEPYTPSTSKSMLKPQYFAQGRSRWTELGLPGCQGVAEGLRIGKHDFTVLDVAQLLKHMLALARLASDGNSVAFA
jgi:hypothetical protein